MPTSEETERDHLLAQAHIGEEVRNFLASHPAGKVLRQRCENELLKIRDELEVADSSDRKLIDSLQRDAKSARNVINWLGDAIIQGNFAAQSFQSTEDAPGDL